MKTFSRIAAQGEITIVRVGDYHAGANLPAGSKPINADAGRLVIGHSETGHHHVMDAGNVVAGEIADAPAGMRVLHLIVSSPTPLVHLREYDTHEPLMVEPGLYRANICREYDPYQQLARQQAD